MARRGLGRIVRAVVVTVVLGAGLPVVPAATRVPALAQVASGSPDPSFGPDGFVTSGPGPLADVALDRAGSVVAAATVEGEPGSARDMAVVRYTASGVLDTSFGDGGTAKIGFGAGSDDEAEMLAVAPDGGVLVAGSASGNPAVAKIRSDGTFDKTFGSGGRALLPLGSGATIADMAIRPSGVILFAATTPDAGSTRLSVVALTSSGKLDASFGTGGIARLRRKDPGTGTDPTPAIGSALVIRPDGAVIAAGTEGALDQQPLVGVFDAAGTQVTEPMRVSILDESGGKVPTTVKAVKVTQDQKVIVAGQAEICFDTEGLDGMLLRLRPDKNAANTGYANDGFFGAQGRSTGCDLGAIQYNDIALQDDGRLVAAGEGLEGSGTHAFVTRYFADGVFDDSFASTSVSRGSAYHAIAIDAQGRIVAAGASGTDSFLARFTAEPRPGPITFREGGTILHWTPVAGRSDVQLIGADRTHSRKVVSAAANAAATLEPDGSRIYFAEEVTGRGLDIKITPAGENEVHEKVSLPGDQSEPTAAEPASELAYTGPNAAGERDIFAKHIHAAPDVAGDNLTAGLAGDVGAPDWQRRGATIVFHHAGDIRTLDRGAPHSYPLLTSGPDEDTDPAWSADGMLVAFSRRKAIVEQPEDAWAQIYVMDRNGANVRRVTSASSDATGPVFSPYGTQIAYTLATVGGGEVRRVSLDGTGDTFVAAGTVGAWRSAMEVTFDDFDSSKSVPTSPAFIPAEVVPLQQQSPAVRSAAIAVQDVAETPIALIDVTTSPIALIDVTTSPIALIDVTTSPIALIDVTTSGISTAVAEGLGAMLLSDLPLNRAGGWEQALEGTKLSGPIQSLTLLDVLRLSPPLSPPIDLGELAISSSPLGAVNPLSIVLGKTPLDAIVIPGGWCSRLEGAGYADCGAALGRPGETGRRGEGASLFELALAGVPLETFPLTEIRVRDVDLDAAPAPLAALPLAKFDLATSNLGSLLLSALTNLHDVVDCSVPELNCQTNSLHDAQQKQAIRSEATFGQIAVPAGNLRLAEVVLGLFKPSANPLQEIPVEKLGIETYNDTANVNNTTPIKYGYTFVPSRTTLSPRMTIRVVLPDGMKFQPGSATFGVPNLAERVRIDPAVRGNELLFAPSTPAGKGGDVLSLEFFVWPGLRLRTAGVAAEFHDMSTGLRETVFNRATITVKETFENDNDSIATAPLLTPDTLYVSHIATADDRDLYRVRVDDPGSQLIVSMAPDDNDNDLLVYAPATAASAEPLRRAMQGPATILPVLPSAVPPRALSLEPLQAEALGDMDLAHIEDLPIVGASSNRGSASETIVAVAPEAGDYFVQVTGYNGSFSDAPYTLITRVEPPAPALPCPARDASRVDLDPLDAPDAPGPALPATIPPEIRTLFIVNRDRLHHEYGEDTTKTMMDELVSLMQQLGNAEIVSVEHSQAVRVAYARWDANPCDPELANDVVREINRVVDDRIDLSARTVENIVLVGSDEALPFARIPDLTQAANERGYADAAMVKGPENAVSGSLRARYMLSDDPYGDAVPSSYFGRWLYVSDVSLGRLVETPKEIEESLKSYARSSGGVLDVKTALTTGYDFMSDLAERNDKAFDAAYGEQPSLIGEGWTAQDVATAFTDKAVAPGHVALNGHFDHTALEPPVLDEALQDGGRFTTSRIAQGPSLERRSVFTIGCHSALSLADVVVGSPSDAQTALVRDWAQSVSRRLGTFAGQTGFGLGLDKTLALSEIVMADFGANVAAGAGTIGQALTRAKQSYLGQIGLFGAYDEKVLSQTVLYGLPFWKVGTNALPSPPAPPAVRTDPTTGLQVADIELSPRAVAQVSDEGRFYSIDGSTQVVHDRPIQPKTHVDVTRPGTRARGAFITSLSSFDEDDFDPVFAAPVVDLASAAPETSTTSSIFPASIHAVTGYLAPDGPRQNLVLVPGQFEATGIQNRRVVGIQRLYTKIGAEVFYSNAADESAPRIVSSEAVQAGSIVVFRVRAADDAPGEVRRVLVMFRDPGGSWRSAELVPDLSAAGVWTAAAPFGTPGTIEFFAQAVDAAGNVSVSSNKGSLFAAPQKPGPPPGVEVTLSGQKLDNGYVGPGTVALEGQPTVGFEFSVDGGTFERYTAPIQVDGEGMRTVDYRSTAGAKGRAIVLVDAVPPTAEISAPADGATYAPGQDVRAAYRCSDTETGAGVASCSGTKSVGSPIETGNPGTYTFRVTAIDRAGRETTHAVTYTVAGRLTAEGFFPPVSSTAINDLEAGKTVTLKWRLRNADGTPRVDRHSVVEVSSTRVVCPSRDRDDDDDDDDDDNGGGTVKPDRRVHSLTIKRGTMPGEWTARWKTSESWEETCRQLVMRFEEGAQLQATFRFDD